MNCRKAHSNNSGGGVKWLCVATCKSVRYHPDPAPPEGHLWMPWQVISKFDAFSNEDKTRMILMSIFPDAVKGEAAEMPEAETTEMEAVVMEEAIVAARDVLTGKSGGPDGTPPGLIKRAILECQAFAKRFLRVTNRSVQLGDMPAQ